MTPLKQVGLDFMLDPNCSGGDFGVPGDGFRTRKSSGKPLLLPVLKEPPPEPPKPPSGQFRLCVKSYPTSFWGCPLIKDRDYKYPSLKKS